jgi:exonuclease VII large subunit
VSREPGHHRLSLAGSKLGDAVEYLHRGVETLRRDAGSRVEFFVQRIVGLGPEATLRRGYAIVRDAAGQPRGTRSQAETQPVLELEFQDSRLRLENQAAVSKLGQRTIVNSATIFEAHHRNGAAEHIKEC